MNYKSVSEHWHNIWRNSVEISHYGFIFTEYRRLAVIAQMEYVTNLALETVHAKQRD